MHICIYIYIYIYMNVHTPADGDRPLEIIRYILGSGKAVRIPVSVK